MQASLWGVGKIIALEYPELHCVCMDLAPESTEDPARVLFAEIFSPAPAEPNEEQIAFRDQNRYVARLAQRQLRQEPTRTGSLAISGEGSYLITGGLGGLGLLVARFLVDRGAQQIILLGRRAPTPAARDQIREMERVGAHISVIQANVADREQLAQALGEVEKSLPPLRGIVHAAGVLDDGVVQQQSWARFEKVMAPKAYGAWHLHKLTQQQPLDFFVLFSSSSTLLGTAGQANHVAANTFLDALAAYRRGQGLPALSINWGAWAEIGATARMQVLDPLRQRGEGSLTPAQGIHYLEQLLLAQAVQVGVMPIDWPLFLQKRSVHSPFFADFSAATKQSATSELELTFRQQLDTATAEQRQALLAAHIEAQVIQVLGWHAGKPLDATLGFFDLGMDSLTSIELRNRLGRCLACALPVTLAFDYPTVGELVAYLSQKLFPTTSEVVQKSGQAISSPGWPDEQATQAVQALQQLSEAEAEALLVQELEGLNF
jgi:NAD(P)-dependent dehydrogenase (short-subunit alcohol dehydrogenase family)/acyl carrier protein